MTNSLLAIGLLGTTELKPFYLTAVVVIPVLALLLFVALIVRCYKRCPSNRILVIYGRVGGNRAAKCIHGGAAFVIPLIQDYSYLSLEPLVIDIPLEGALSLNNIRVNVPSTFTVGISTDDVLMNNAAERLLNLPVNAIREQCQDIILGQLRLVIATLSIEEINKDREKFMTLINENVEQEINKIGLELINVNIRDITDESGYIQAIGKRAAAEAINRAKVEVAQQEREGATGEAIAVRERTVNVAREIATGVEGEKKAEQAQRIAVAAMEAQAVTGEAQSQRDREIAVAQRAAETETARKQAEREQRIRVAEAEATAVTGENTSRIQIAESTAAFREVDAETKRRAEVAAAKAQEAILIAERERELARLAKEELAPQEIERKRIEIAAGAEAEKVRIEAQGEADAIFAKYEAEARGVQKVLEAKAEGYRRLIEACGADAQVGPTLLLIEQLPQLVAEQVKAISALKIDKITVWDTGSRSDGSGRNTTSDFLAGMVNSLPRLHELATQAGIELPPALGRVRKQKLTRPEGIHLADGEPEGEGEGEGGMRPA
ncbi:MAG TPA: SPFH domain-containing protein [Phycisphaerales bacterium]|nr:SPFH domain-containing protein [Phycisphaerales bacterium]HMP36522.1 SPFH domain-containing protein [Phycisphaerales bacterium]